VIVDRGVKIPEGLVIGEDPLQACMPADIDLGQNDRLLEHGVGMDMHPGEEQGLAQGGAGDDAAA
ncbi:MAG TPA: hypothetical protein VHG35_17250, partial [Gemmatimonadales bacterium]|nr:hypothetical protein [Gemmatimonadales bacterium]